MKLREIYERAIRKGIKEDPRPSGMIEKDVAAARKEYRKLKGARKKAYDRERLKHPYADSRILYGNGNEEITTVLTGIDMDVPEILLADRLREKGVKVDLVLSHHPSGRAFAQLDKVMAVQPGIWETLGLSKEIAEGIMKDRMEEVGRGIASRNHNRAVDAARLLGIPFMCLHTAADNCVTSFLQKTFNRKKPKKLKHVMSILERLPEYKHAMKVGAGPHILIGDVKSDAGKVFIDMTGGTGGPDRIFSRLSQAGIKTVIGMHVRDSGYKAAKAEFLNYVIAGHIASDNLGVNILLDAIDPGRTLKVIECSGFKRFRR